MTAFYSVFLSDVGLVLSLQVVHGLWVLDLKDIAAANPTELWVPVHTCAHFGMHGSYDMCSTAYANAHGVREGFILDASRDKLAFTARSHDAVRGIADELFVVALSSLGLQSAQPCPALASGKGWYVTGA